MEVDLSFTIDTSVPEGLFMYGCMRTCMLPASRLMNKHHVNTIMVLSERFPGKGCLLFDSQGGLS